MNGIGDEVALVDDAGVPDHRFELEHASFDEGLFLFGVFVLGVFRDVAELFGLADALVDFAAVNGLELVKLVLEFLEAVAGQNDLFIAQNRLLGTRGVRAQ